MSSGPYTQPGGRSIPVPGNPALPKKRAGCGCLGSISGAIALIFVVTILINPWALHMGGRWTPALVWHGVGKLQSTSGANYGLFLEVNPFVRHGRHGGMGGGTNLTGTAKICTPQGDVYPLTVSGSLKRAWLDADGKSVTFYFHSLKGASTKLDFELLGAWQGHDLVLEDRGNMAMSFAPDGRAKGYLKGTNSPKENTTGSLRYATESEFTAACNGKNGNGF